MTYWHMQLHPSGKEKEYNPEEIVRETELIGMGYWKEGEPQIKQFKNVMKIGDIVLVRQGAEAKVLVEVIGNLEDEKENQPRLDWFRFRRKIKILDFANNLNKFPYTQGTLKSAIDSKTKTYQYIHEWYRKTIHNTYSVEDIIEGTYKLKSIYIKDYKMFNNFELDFCNSNKVPLPLIVIAGKNGTGKTSLLEYLIKNKHSNEDYLHIVQSREPRGLDDWNNDNDFILDDFKIIEGMAGIKAKKDEYKEHVYYLPVNINNTTDIEDEIVKYYIHIGDIEDLTRTQMIKKLQEYIEDIFNGLELSFNISRVDLSIGEVFFKNKMNVEFNINHLSTGEKTLFSKVLYLYLKRIKNKIILIDEPELSLHPSWQNKVLKIYENFALKNNCQIIIATHSPHIIGSAKNEYLRILRKNDEGRIEVVSGLKAEGRDINSILFDVMGEVAYRPREFDDKIDRLHIAIDDRKIEEAKERLEALKKSYGESDEVVMEAQMLIDMFSNDTE